MKLILYLFLINVIFVSCQKELKDIVNDSEKAIFTIYTYDEFGSPSGNGSGFFIDEKGTGITNYHVLDGAIKAILKTSDGEKFEIDKVIASDKRWDIIKFTTKNADKKFNYLKFSKSNIEKGDVVYNISSPLGLENSVSEGIVSSIREDSHGKIIQTTTPISPGSSGSALLNTKGEVFAVATFNRVGGQNLNFGVEITDKRIKSLTSNPFVAQNKKFNKKDNFIIINAPCDNNHDITLNALEFNENVTVAYFSYTNLELSFGENMLIWCEIGIGDEGFMIHDLDRDKKYYVTSSTIGIDKAHGTEVVLASNIKFKVFFPPIKEQLNNINITYGQTTRGWQFKNINLNKYRRDIHLIQDNYQKEYAYSSMHAGNLDESIRIFSDILDKNPGDSQALNALGIISIAIDNKSDAEYYFSEAIKSSPNSSLSYSNRAQLYQAKGEYQMALQDFSKAINLDKDHPDNYVHRASLYMQIGSWYDAENDLNIALKTKDYKRNPIIYMYRAICRMQQGYKKNASKDIEIAYSLTNDPELEDTLERLWDEWGCGYY